MNLLIPVFLACFLAELGGRVQAQAQGHVLAGVAGGRIALAVLLVSLVHYSLVGVAGVLIGRMMPANGRDLMFALALLAAGLPLLLPAAKRVSFDAPAGPVSLVSRLATVQFGDAPSFLVFAAAARTREPVLAVIGAVCAVQLIVALPLFLRGQWPGALPIRALRALAALVLVLFGLRGAAVALGVI